ncbi:sigma-B regulation protein RsbU (phosphoserine phosphatase) [Micromonospora sp. A202]|uniref:PP2C family protein-serine/threonine phosphatase n=1 Tax=Micromonospora sp. A202 TaxID=2572899 RepID=UPI0011532286|nr:SpoIIE family protein phosphatase [Micromonospora sp. A202]TQJ23447.1 sigma-B regulation protein RsbU (phosphoserine phosphatase) [Micromonospora sp. A202]
MTAPAGPDPHGQGPGDDGSAQPSEVGFSALLEDDLEDLYENAPCGQLSTLLDGTIAKINGTLLAWLGYRSEELVGRRRFSDLLTGGGRIYHETHFAPMLAMRGEIGGVALDLRTKDGVRMPVLVTSVVKGGSEGQPQLIRTAIFDATMRRAYERELLNARKAAEREDERLRHLVSKLQRSLLPAVLQTPPGMESAAYYRAASTDQVGGDFYDLFPLVDGRWGFFLGDVSGKGVEAAAVTALARYTLRAATVYDPDPAAALHNLNTVLWQEYREDARYCTVVFGILTPTSTVGGFTAVIASGGHPEPLLLRADGSVHYHLTKGRIVGAFPNTRYTNTILVANPGDTLLLYSDGLTEARTTGGETADGRYGAAALARFAGSLAPATAATAVMAVTELLATFGDGLTDDTAVLAIGAPSRRD